MVVIMVVGMVLVLGMGLVIFIVKDKFEVGECEVGKVFFVLGLCFIFEGVIFFVVKDLMCVILVCMVGGVVIGVFFMLFGVKLMVLYGGLFVFLILNVISLVLLYLVVIVVGMVITGFGYVMLKKLV